MTVCLLWAIELFGSHRWSLTPMFQAFQLRGLTAPFLLRPHTLSISHFLCLNCETLIGCRPKYELTTHSSTLMMDDNTHAHSPNIMRCPCAYAMLMPLHVLMYDAHYMNLSPQLYFMSGTMQTYITSTQVHHISCQYI